MAKARAILKRRKAVRNIRKITRTMQMIATAKFQRALKRAVGAKPYTTKMHEVMHEVGMAVSDQSHPLLRRVTPEDCSGRIALLVITSNRGLCGAYNGNVLRTAAAFIAEQDAAGTTVELHLSGRKGVTYFNYRRRPIARRYDQFGDEPRWADVEQLAAEFIRRFVNRELDGVHVAHMNFISTSTQRPEVFQLLPLVGVREAADRIIQQFMEKEAQALAGAWDRTHRPDGSVAPLPTGLHAEVTYDFSPDARTILEELLPLAVKMSLYQCFLDAASSEHVARMVAMKSATDNADKMLRTLTMQYNRSRQTQITTELSEIMGGVEAMKRRQGR